MTIIFLAECGNKQQAELLSQHFDVVSWTLRDGDTECQCHIEIKQDFEGNWWCSLSVNAMDWTPANRQEANYRHFQILELQSLLQEHLKSAPAFRYAFAGEIGGGDLNYLLTDSSRDYAATYNCLFSSRASNQFRIPTFVYVLKVRFLLSESLWQQVGSPSNFETLIRGYVWLPPAPTLVWGGVQAPPKENINQTEIQVILDPEEAENYNHMGVELTREGRFAEALANFEKAQKLYPFSPIIHQNKAASLYCLKRFSEALQQCDFSIRLNPSLSDLVILHQLKGDIFYEQGQLEKALASFQDSLDLNPDAFYAVHPHSQKALILSKLGRYKESLAPQYEEGLNLLNSSQYAAALDVFNALNQSTPEFAKAFYCKGLALGNLGRHEEALAAFEAALRLDPTFEVYFSRAHALYSLGRIEEALESYNTLLALYPDNAYGYYRKGVLLDELGRYEAALELLHQAVKLEPNSAQVHLSKGIVLDHLGRSGEALQALNESLRLDPSSPQTQNSWRIVMQKLSGGV